MFKIGDKVRYKLELATHGWSHRAYRAHKDRAIGIVTRIDPRYVDFGVDYDGEHYMATPELYYEKVNKICVVITQKREDCNHGESR